MMADTLGSSSHIMERVFDLSPSPDSEPQTDYPPLRRKRPLFHHDGDDSVIELTDSTESRSSTPCKRRKRRARSRSGPNAESNGSPSGLWSQTQTLRCSAFSQVFVYRVNIMEL